MPGKDGLYKPDETIGNFTVQGGENIPGCRLGVLGMGGFGLVYYAVNRHNRKEVAALKTLRTDSGVSLEDYRKFQREAEFWSNLETHANIVQAKTFFLNEDHVVKVRPEKGGAKVEQAMPFLALEFIEGKTLSALLRDEEILAPLQACLYADQFCRGMINAVERTRTGPNPPQLLHRDISPDNVMISRNRNLLKLNDFGLARFAGAKAGELSRLAGKLLYMSPEQYGCRTHQALERLTPASDIWAFAVTMYKALTGRHPYQPESEQELMHLLHASDECWTPSIACSLNREAVSLFDPLFTRCFRREAKERPQAWQEVLTELGAIQDRLGELKMKGLTQCRECGYIQYLKDKKHCALCEAELPEKPVSSPKAKPAPGPAVKPASPPASVQPLAAPWEDGAGVEKPAFEVNLGALFGAEAGRAPGPAPAADTHGLEFIQIPEGVHRYGLNDLRLDKLMAALYGPEVLNRQLPARLKNQREHLGAEHPMLDIPLGAFSISKYPVTVGQFRQFLAATGYTCPAGDPCPTGLDGDLPVTKVTYDDAQAYCHWGGFRLPTLYEWQYAASGGDDRLYPWGDEFNSDLIMDGRRNAGRPEKVGFLSDVPSRFGLVQMGGNVWEFLDCGTSNQGKVFKAMVGGSYKSDGRLGGMLNQIRYLALEPERPARGAEPDIGFRVCLDTRPAEYRPSWLEVPSGAFTAGCRPEFARALVGQFALDRESGLKTLLSFGYGKQTTGAFSLAEFPVTNAQYLEYIRATKAPPPRSWRTGNPFGPFFRQEALQPVCGVSFEEAAAYCHWAGGRLPSGPEWEKAARGTGARHYPWGDVYDVRRCNTAEFRLGRPSTPFEFTQGASPFGALSVCGNVYEYAVPKEKPGAMELRGGSWTATCEIYGAAFFSITARTGLKPEISYGFRMVRD